jgi:putative DNA primase/helicase
MTITPINLQAIAAHYGGEASGDRVNIPTPGHSRRDRGTTITLAPGRPDGVLVYVRNGGNWQDVMADLRRDGFIPNHGQPVRQVSIRDRREAERRRARLADEARAKVSAEATTLFREATPADPTHPYLMTKQLKPFGVRQSGRELLVPMCDRRFRLCQLQRIRSGKQKWFLSGGPTDGLFWHHGLNLEGPVVIAEGYATAAACHEATGFAVVAAMTVGNLAAVATIMRALFGDRQIVVAADWDGHGGGLGLRVAQEATEVARGILALPVPTGTDCDSTTLKIDFADISRAEARELIGAARNGKN